MEFGTNGIKHLLFFSDSNFFIFYFQNSYITNFCMEMAINLDH